LPRADRRLQAAPRSYHFRTEPLPLSATGKVLKTELRKPYREGETRQVA